MSFKLLCPLLQYQMRFDLYSTALATVQTLDEAFHKWSADVGKPLRCICGNVTMWRSWPPLTSLVLASYYGLLRRISRCMSACRGIHDSNASYAGSR